MANMYPSKKAGGSNPTETVLWTNSDPSTAFSGQTANLSQSLANFDAVKIVSIPYAGQTSSTMESIYEMEYFNKTGNHTGYYNDCALCGGYSSSHQYTRIIKKNSDTAIYFTLAYRFGWTSSDNSYIIPTQIIGIKY